MKKHVFVAMAAMISMAWMTGCSGGESKETAADTKAESCRPVLPSLSIDAAGMEAKIKAWLA